MDPYRIMYHTLFNRVTDAIEALQAAQIAAEELFLDDPPNEAGKSFPESPGR